jgi:hypothetical protein
MAAWSRFEREKPRYAGVTWAAGNALMWYPPEVETHYEKPVNSYCRFRRQFELPAAPGHATLRLFADSRYQLFINGQYVGRGPCRSDPRWQYFDELEVAPYLRAGANVIAVQVLFFGYGTGQSIDRIPALLVEGQIDCGAAGAVTVIADDGWKCAKAAAFVLPAPRINGCQGPIEVFDARLEDEEWAEIGFDDATWGPVKRRGVQLTPFWNWVPREIPLLEEGHAEPMRLVSRGTVAECPEPLERLHWQILNEEYAVNVRPVAAGEDAPRGCRVEATPAGSAAVLTYEFDRVVAGYLQLEATGPAGAVIDAIYVEELWQGRAVLNANNNRSVDRFILRAGANHFEVAFGWKACRYVQLRVRNPQGAVVVERLALRTRAYPTADDVAFTCGDATLQAAWQLSAYTLQLCRQDGFLDSSSREQQQWMGDGRWQAVMHYYLNGDARLHRKLLRQFCQSQDCEGLTTSRYPDAHHNYPPIPSFCLQWLCSFADYHLYTGARDVIDECWPNMVLAARWFSGFENAAGLLEGVPYWAFLDWGDRQGHPLDVERGGMVTGLNLQYLEALHAVALCGALAGDSEAAAFFERKAARLAESIARELWDEEQGAYPDCKVQEMFSAVLSQPTNALALLLLHAPGEPRSAQILQRMFGDEAGINIGSPYFMTVIGRALQRHGQAAQARAMIRKRYGAMLAAGATTAWERWELVTTDAQGKAAFSSASHAWGSAPLVFFAESILGIRPLAPGFTLFAVEPELGELQSARGTVPTPHGHIDVALRREGAHVMLEITVPPGCEGLHGATRLCAGRHVVPLA